MSSQRRIPPINTLATRVAAHFDFLPHHAAVRLARLVAEQLRRDERQELDETLIQRVCAPVLAPGPKPVINATGILLHTNLGRCPLPRSVIEAALASVAGYTDLEMDLESGKRGHRDRHFATLARLIWEVEDATLVNNAAGAVALALGALGGGRETIVSRGELIEIGGSFRLPDIMGMAGTRLVEVGTTNKTRLADYEGAIGEGTGCLLKTHTSNYRIEGFTQDVALADLVGLGRRKQVPVIMDLGSGLSKHLPFPSLPEPFIEDYLAAEPDLLIFSGDKLFGSVQAGIVLGKKEAVHKLRKHPMMRMLRQDKLSISILCHQLKETWFQRTLPLSERADVSMTQLEQRAANMVEQLQGIDVEAVATEGYIGGGSLPGEQRPALALALRVPDPAQLAYQLRNADPAVVGYLKKDTFYLNLASVFPEQDAVILEHLRNLLLQS